LAVASAGEPVDSVWPPSPRSANPDSPGSAFSERKRAEGKTKTEALRAFKRRVSDAIYRELRADTQPTHR
jgi:hypothetical protein